MEVMQKYDDVKNGLCSTGEIHCKTQQSVGWMYYNGGLGKEVSK